MVRCFEDSEKPYPQIPVLRTAIVTCPGSRSSGPFCTLSRDGSAAFIHRSWAGLVYTPMFVLVAIMLVLLIADVPSAAAKFKMGIYVKERTWVDEIDRN